MCQTRPEVSAFGPARSAPPCAAHGDTARHEALAGPPSDQSDQEKTVTGKPISASRVVLSQIMQPLDANVSGNVHGGVILRLMDEAGGVAATRHCRARTVTAAIDSFSFLSPVYVGNLVTVKASLNWVGHSSMEVGVHVEAEDLRTGEITHTASGYLAYVCLDADGRPRQVPALLPETDEDRRRMAEAEERQQARLKMRKRGG